MKLSVSLLFAVTCSWWLPGCHQTPINFTPHAAPQLPEFDALEGAPSVAPLTALAPTAVEVVPLASGQSLHLFPETRAGVNRIRLVAISPGQPFNNINVLLKAFQHKRDWIVASHPLACTESIAFRATLHSISIGIDCRDSPQEALRVLMSFWDKAAFEALDIASIRRQLKLSKHIDAFSGAEIDKLWAKKVLGEQHSYNRALDDSEVIDSLDLHSLNRIQQRIKTQASWSLFATHTDRPADAFIADASQLMRQLPAASATATATATPKHQPPGKQQPDNSQKIVYLIDAPGSVQTQVRVGYGVAVDAHQPVADSHGPVSPVPSTPYLDKPYLDSHGDEHLGDKHHSDAFSCKVLASWLGRSFSGRLFFDLREQRGLTYGIYGRCRDNPLARTLKFYGSTKLEHSGAFIAGILSHLSLAQSQAATARELESLKTFMISSQLLAQSTPERVESSYVNRLIRGYDAGYSHRQALALDALDTAGLQQMAQARFSEPPFILVRGDADKIMADLEDKLPGWDIERTEVD